MSYYKGLIAYHKFNDYAGGSLDFDYFREGGSPTPQTLGSPSITNDSKFGDGSLLLNSTEYLYFYGSDTLEDLVQKGCVEFFVKPGYSGSPTVDQHFFCSMSTDKSDRNYIDIWHDTNGKLYIDVADSSSVSIFVLDVLFNPDGSSWYHISLSFDVTSGSSKVFIDGVRQNITSSTGTRSTSQYVSFGTDYNMASFDNDFEIDDVRIYDEDYRTNNFFVPSGELIDDYDADINSLVTNDLLVDSNGFFVISTGMKSGE